MYRGDFCFIAIDNVNCTRLETVIYLGQIYQTLQGLMLAAMLRMSTP